MKRMVQKVDDTSTVIEGAHYQRVGWMSRYKRFSFLAHRWSFRFPSGSNGQLE